MDDTTPAITADGAMLNGAMPEVAADPLGLITAAGKAWEFAEAGGPVVLLLLAMSVLAVAIILLKLWQFHTLGLIGRRPGLARIETLNRTGRTREALTVARGINHPAARALALALRGRIEDNLPEETLREEVARAAGAEIDSLSTYLRPLEVIATLAPLLGLFGTVIGMIAAFQQLELAGNNVNPAVLSGGIWVALLTTAVGLGVAIPVVAVLNGLERTVERTAAAIENAVTQVFTRDTAIVLARPVPKAAPASQGATSHDTVCLQPGVAAGE